MAGRRVVWTKNAQTQRREILEYWKSRIRSNSKKLNDIFKEAVSLITFYPYLGKRIKEENVRVRIVRDYNFYYEVTSSSINILALWDTRRNPEKSPYKP